ncbi:MAG: hypothetical protein JWO38_6880, partial [Gemmataceae bacterium]|nr:hypothetical protein [Gemmataceae bacterium]
GAGSEEELAGAARTTWAQLRAEREVRWERQVEQRQFRRDPQVYLPNLEITLNQLRLLA